MERGIDVYKRQIEHFGGKEYAVSAVPDNLYGLNGQSLLLELIDGLGSVSEKDTPDMVVEKIASKMCIRDSI